MAPVITNADLYQYYNMSLTWVLSFKVFWTVNKLKTFVIHGEEQNILGFSNFIIFIYDFINSGKI